MRGVGLLRKMGGPLLACGLEDTSMLSSRLIYRLLRVNSQSEGKGFSGLKVKISLLEITVVSRDCTAVEFVCIFT